MDVDELGRFEVVMRSPWVYLSNANLSPKTFGCSGDSGSPCPRCKAPSLSTRPGRLHGPDHWHLGRPNPPVNSCSSGARAHSLGNPRGVYTLAPP